MATRPRIREFDIDFTGPAAAAAGWAIPPVAAFRGALDIQQAEQVEDGRKALVWTQGLPPAYGFSAGDIFYDPPEIRYMRWGAEEVVRAVQVASALPDQEMGADVISGEVVYEAWEGTTRRRVRRRRVTQEGFVDFLRTGVEPPELTGPAAAIIRRVEVIPLDEDAKPKERRRWEIDYDQDDGRSRWKVRPLALHRYRGAAYLRAWVEAAKAVRMLDVARISRLTDLDSGEVVDGADAAVWIVGAAGQARNAKSAEANPYDGLKPHFRRTHDAKPGGRPPDQEAEGPEIKLRDVRFARHLSGHRMTIEYVDSTGTPSRREIIIKTLKTNGERALLLAYCLDVADFRTYRYDRIGCVIDGDGEVHDTQAYFDRLGVTVRALYGDLPPEESPPEERPKTTRRRPARPAFGVDQMRIAWGGMNMLAGLSRADGTMHEAEVDVIVEYIVNRAAVEGVGSGENDRSVIAAAVRRLYPSDQTIDASCAAINAESRDNQVMFVRAAIELVDADGVRHQAEMDILKTILDWLGDD